LLIGVGIGQVVVVVHAEKHAVPARESRHPPCDIQTLRPDAPSRAEQLRTREDRIDFGVGKAVVDVDVIGEDVEAGLVETPSSPAGNDRPGLPSRHARSFSRAASALIPGPANLGSTQVAWSLHQPHTVLNEPADQRRPVLRRHREIVIAERLQAELHTADERPIVSSNDGAAWLLDDCGTGASEAHHGSRRAHDGNSPEFATRHIASTYDLSRLAFRIRSDVTRIAAQLAYRYIASRALHHARKRLILLMLQRFPRCLQYAHGRMSWSARRLAARTAIPARRASCVRASSQFLNATSGLRRDRGGTYRVLGIAIGLIAVVDLRLLSQGIVQVAPRRLIRATAIGTLIGFITAITTGFMISRPTRPVFGHRR
jgi:hypothetical protein